MKLRLFAVLFLLLLSINVVGASLSYWSEGTDSGDRVFFATDLAANTTHRFSVVKTSGYSPDIKDVMEFGCDWSTETTLDTTDEWTIVSGSPSITDGTLQLANSGSAEIIRSQETFPYGSIVETSGYHPTANQMIFGYYSVSETYAVWAGRSGSDYADYVFTKNSASTWTDDNVVRGGTTFYNYAVAYESGTASFFVDDDLRITATTNIPSGDMPIAITSEASAGTNVFEYVFVRQYISDEPTVMVSDEGDYYLITVTENSGNDLTNYQVCFDATDISLSSTDESLQIEEVSDPFIILELNAPANNSCLSDSELSYNVSGYGNLSASVLIDGVNVYTGSVVEGTNQYNATVSQGLHSWYINGSATYNDSTVYNESELWFFTYDTINPYVSDTDINPTYENIANGTIVQTNIEWSDSNLKNASFYVDYGSGYSIEDSTIFSSSLEWFNTSINTTGYTGESISWYQIAYDEAGNNYTYSDSFNVVESALNIYVYDETTSDQILPSNVVIYNEDISKEATISDSTMIASLDYNGLSSDRYIVRVSADDYYSRNSILYVDVESLAELNVYLPSENETVIFDQFALTDNTGSYDEGECIVRLDKPLTNGTDTVFSSYFDFDGVASTYLIATDQYILYVETPDKTISYGWLSPDSDGVIDIVISNTQVGEIEEWLNYSLTHDDYGVISLSYESNLEIDRVSFCVNATNGTNLYTASSLSDAGSFTYTGSNNSTYYASFSALSESGKTVSITRVITFTGSGVQDDLLNFLPEDAPDWLYNLIGGSIVVISVLMFGQFRMDVGCVIGAALTGLFWYWGLLQITGIVVAVGVIIAVAAVLSRSRRS